MYSCHSCRLYFTMHLLFLILDNVVQTLLPFLHSEKFRYGKYFSLYWTILDRYILIVLVPQQQGYHAFRYYVWVSEWGECCPLGERCRLGLRCPLGVEVFFENEVSFRGEVSFGESCPFGGSCPSWKRCPAKKKRPSWGEVSLWERSPFEKRCSF